MSGTTYVVAIDFQTKGDLLSPAIAASLKEANMATKSFEQGLEQAKQGVISLGSTAAGAFTGLVESVGKLAMVGGAIGAAGLMGAIHHGVLGVNAELETTTSSMAAIFNAQGYSNTMPEALGLAREQMTAMRHDAKALPGELADLANIMRTVMPSAAQMGMKVDDVRKMSGTLMAAGTAVGMEMGQVAREAAQLLEGRAGSHNVLGMRLMGLSGDKAKKFNQLSDDERVKKLNEELGKYGPAIDAISGTFQVVASTLKDNLSGFAGDATRGIFGNIKEDMSLANKWFEDNKDYVNAWSHSIGTHLVAAYEFGRHKILEWGPILFQFAENAYDRITKIVTALAPTFERVESAAKTFFGDPASMDKIESILKLYAAVKVGQAAAGPASDLFSIGAGIGKMLPALLGGGGAAGGAAAGEAGIVAAAGTGSALTVAGDFLVTVFPPLLAVMAGAAAAFKVFGSDEGLHNRVVDALDNVQIAFRRLAHSPAVEQISFTLGKIGEGMVSLFESATEFVGSGILESIVTGFEGIRVVLEGLETVSTNAVTYLRKVSDTITDLFHGKGTAFGDDQAVGKFNDTDAKERAEEIRRRYIDYQSDKPLPPSFGMYDAYNAAAAKAKENEAKKSGKAPKSSTNVQKVEIVVSSNADPARIARLVYDNIQNLARHPKIARNAPRFGV